MIRVKLILSGMFVLLGGAAPQLHAQALELDVPDSPPGLDDDLLERDLVNYPARFFDRFQPVTALDIVRQVPGFQLDDDVNDVRGFASAGGNVLIDDRRPSTKRDSLTNILSRIPASTVARVELIRGQVRSIDLRGQSAVVNLILREGIPAAIQWEAAIRETFGHGAVTPSANISLADTWKGIDFNVGLNARKGSVGRTGTEDVFDSLGDAVENRFDHRGNRNTFITASLNAAYAWIDTYLQLNTSLQYAKRRTFTDSKRFDAVSGAQQNIFFDDNQKEPVYEIGIDLERSLSPNLVAKGIFLGVVANEDILNTQQNSDSVGNQTLFRVASGDMDSKEVIARVEFDWTRFTGHVIQMNAERAYNVLDSTLIQTDDRGAGPVVVDVPGANSRVEEIRWDFLIKDTWRLGRFELDYGLGAEASTIRQTGDAELERDFFFVKPQAVLSYSAVESSQTRLRLAREIAQLNLEDFVSATEFVDNDIALGNPNIKPDATWKLEFSQEKRLGANGVVKLTLFHDWISDVLDLLPLTPTFEAPGNIGDGRRWGVKWEATLPLDRLGLRSARLDVKLRWQDSTVVDPVTGEDRVLSIGTLSAGPILFDVENRYAYTLDYRQDIPSRMLAWGWGLWERAEQLRFKVNELEIYDDDAELRAFIEITRPSGIKLRLDAENLLDFADTRERTVFVGERDLSPLDFRQYRDRTRGMRLALTLSGSF